MDRARAEKLEILTHCRNFDTLQKLESSVQSLMQNIWQLQELADAHRSQGT